MRRMCQEEMTNIKLKSWAYVETHVQNMEKELSKMKFFKNKILDIC